MKRALVLGGGGLVGTAWETGIVHGLLEAGVDVRAPEVFDAYVGTSAGAIVSSQLAAGQLPATPDQYKPPPPDAPPLIDQSALDMQAIGAIFTIWAKMERTTAADAQRIGGFARGLYRDAEQRWIDNIARAIDGLAEWPLRELFVSAVDTETGETRYFTRDDRVALVHAVAASSSVPGLFTSVEIDGRRYMDGQVHSSTHAHVLAPRRPQYVLVAMPTNVHTAPQIGAHAERAAADEIELLRAAGTQVRFVTPSAEDAQILGTNLMNAKRVRDSFAVGQATGRTLADELR